MATYDLSKLLSLWAQGELTIQQAIGHILQQLVTLEKRISRLEQQRS